LIVELFARRRAGRTRLDPQEYIELHRQLITISRALASSANEVEAAFYGYLEDLLKPWMDLDIMGRADRDILFDLLIRCRHVDAQLGGRSWFCVLRGRRVPAFLGALSFAIILLCMNRISVLFSTVMGYAQAWSYLLYLRAIYSTDVERLFVVGLVLIAVSIYMVSRTARS
jgi:hypothetical protein